MSNSGFGEHLRREREMRGVSLEEIAGATRISTRFLEALEKEAWDRLPGGVFNRGFVRTVARFLGLEEESLLAEYSLALRLPGTTPVPSALPQAYAHRRFPWIALAVVPVVLALAAGGWWGWRWISARRTELNAAANLIPAAPAPPAAPPSLWADAAVPPTEPQQNSSSWAALPSPPVNRSAAGLSPALQLKVDAVKETALTITSDGQQIFSGNIPAGESRSFSAQNALTVSAQDAGAVRLELNGQALQPIGPAGQPGKMTFSSKRPFERPNPKPNPGGHN